MKPSDQDHLLRELLGDDGLESLRRASLEGALASLRVRRRRTVLTTATANLTLLLSLALLTRHEPTALRLPATNLSNVPPLAASTLVEPTNAGVKIISDEELFALFPGRSMALIGPPGQQRFVFLDQPLVENESP